ncbi:hypothetical protein [Aliidongia dinghuensis]|nr:hypothetical protein [Aliidongia dinghuensis]
MTKRAKAYSLAGVLLPAGLVEAPQTLPKANLPALEWQGNRC